MFNRIGIFGCNKVSEVMPDILRQNFPEIPWLIEQGVLFEPTIDHTGTIEPRDEETQNSFNSAIAFMEKHREYITGVLNNEEKLLSYAQQMLEEEVGVRPEQKLEVRKALVFSLISGELLLRPLSAYYRNIRHIDAIPIISGKLPELPQQTGSVEEVIKVAINHLPAPDDSTSWEQIMDFRSDPNTERKFLDLRNWMNKTARAKLTPLEIEQELESLLQVYQQHMELHRMKTNASTLETIIVTGAEIAENLVKLQFGKLAKGLFHCDIESWRCSKGN